MSNLNDDRINLQDYLKSYWIASTEQTNYPTLEEDISVDVVIVGGGIVGITSGYLLKKQGIRVAIIEASKIAQGTTGFTTAKITSQHHLIYDKIISSMGINRAEQYANASESSIDFVENMIKELNIDCDFERVPSYIYTENESYVDNIEKEAEAALKLGIKARYVEDLPINLKIKSALVFENQAQFHPRKYLLPMSAKIPGDGSYIFENTKAMEVQKGNEVIITTNKSYKIKASKLIIASSFPFYDGLGLYLARLRPERSYIVATHIKENFPKAMFISAEKPRRSLRYQQDGEKQLILVGGDGHKVAHGDDFNEHYNNLKEFANSLFTVNSFQFEWSSQDYITLDKIPYIGKLTLSEENIYVATGFKKWGMTNGTTAARIITDKILGKANPFEAVFNPSRSFTLDAYKNLVTENFDVAKELILGKLKQGEYKITLNPGEGKVINIDGNKYGAYKDEKEILHLIDITCTHLGCELKWNDAEKSWDCPCHGSRFTFDGEILNGPATHKLNHYKEGENKINPNFT